MLATLVFLGAALSIWIAFLANQQLWQLILSVYFFVILVAYILFRQKFPGTGLIGRSVFGAGIGYGAMVLGAMINNCAFRGAICLQRDILSDLTFFPSVSLGWLFGAILFALKPYPNPMHRGGATDAPTTPPA